MKMRIESVFKVNLKGEFECLYAGTKRQEARKIYLENLTKKDEYHALFQQSGYSSRSMSGKGFQAHWKGEETKPIKTTRKRRTKKADEAE